MGGWKDDVEHISNLMKEVISDKHEKVIVSSRREE